MNCFARTDAAVQAVTDVIRERAGLVFPPARRSDVEAGIRAFMAKAGIADCGECLERLATDPGALDDLLAELVVGETYFFRHPEHFTFIRDEIIPDVRQRRGAEHVLRAWSAGCASGEEAYSLAILFDECGLAQRSRILATDISRAALARAGQANYGKWSLRGDGARIIGRYLHRSGGRFELAESLRQRVEFAYLNLAEDAYPSFATGTWGMDLVLCRNVFIYLDPKTVRAIARRLYDCLAAGGFLIAGPSDPALAEHAPFESLITPAGVIYQKPVTYDACGAPPPSSLFSQSPVPPAEPAVRAPFPGAAPSSQPAPIERHPAMAPSDPLAEARSALARGDNARVVERTRLFTLDLEATVLRVRALANLGYTEEALANATEAAARHPTSVEMGFLHAILLMSHTRYAEAERALQRVLYLDGSLAVAHFALGATLHRLGNRKSAMRAYRNARDLASRRPTEEILALTDGERAGQLSEAAAARLEILDAERGAGS